MRFYLSFFLFLVMLNHPCIAQFDFEGHRGARGLMPENTIPAFIKALDLGVTTLEMDVVISKDKKVVVSHDPFLSHEITTTPEGKSIREKNEETYNLYDMNYKEIKTFDVGKKKHPRFPRQEKLTVFKPLLSEVIKAAEHHVKDTDRNEVYYNIEIKSREEWDDIHHPRVGEYCELVVKTIQDYLPTERVMLQSFDIRALQYLHEYYPEITLAYLIENKKSEKENLDNLGFLPDVYSPEYILLKKKNIEDLHEMGVKVIPWTVNERKDMEELIEWGVDGLISDYPDLLMIVGEEKHLQ
ncbi:glycerophosphodiester phosphodiesterase [Persicobacter diffluens]